MSNRNVSGLCDSDDIEQNFDLLSGQCRKFSGILNVVLRDALNYVSMFNKNHDLIDQACLDIAGCYETAICAVYPIMSSRKSKKSIAICDSYIDRIAEKYEFDDSELKEFSLQIKSYNKLCMGLIDQYHESEKLLSKEIIKLS